MTSELNWDIFIKNWDLLNNNEKYNSLEKGKNIKIKNQYAVDFDHEKYIKELKRKNQISSIQVETKNHSMIDDILKQQKNKKNRRTTNSSVRPIDKTKKIITNPESLNFEQSDLNS